MNIIEEIKFRDCFVYGVWILEIIFKSLCGVDEEWNMRWSMGYRNLNGVNIVGFGYFMKNNIK